MNTKPTYTLISSMAGENKFLLTFVNGAKAEILGNILCEYEVNFIDQDTGENVYGTTIKNNMWSSPIPKYYVNWRIEVKKEGVVVAEETLKLHDKKVKIVLDTQSLGDLIAYIGVVDAFQKKHGCELYCVVFNQEVRKIFEKSYKNITFLSINEKDEDYYTTYKVGYFSQWPGLLKTNPKKMSLVEIALEALGMGQEEIVPALVFNQTLKPSTKKYVCIAIQSTAQCKYWNRKDGWEEVIKYLNQLGYEVWCIDKNNIYGRGMMNRIPKGAIDKTGDQPLESRLAQINDCEFFIGLSSGLAWVAWALKKPAVLISGFTERYNEFSTPYRIINENVCHGCWNDVAHEFDKGNWNWCPRNKNFECSKEITPAMVISCIDKIHGGQVPEFKWGPNITDRTKYLLSAEFFSEEKCAYEKLFEVEPNDVVVDIGAHIGLFCRAIKKRQPSRIIAIEPSTIRFDVLKGNTTDLPVTIVKKGVGDSEQFVKNGLIFDNVVEDMEASSFSNIMQENGVSHIDFLKIDCEGGEYSVFNETNIDWILKNVSKIAGEWHLADVEQKAKFRNFRDNILSRFKNYEVRSTGGDDIKAHIFNETVIDNNYCGVMIYIDNRSPQVVVEFDFDRFFSKYDAGIRRSGMSRYHFYKHVIPKLVAKNKPLYILETGTMWAPFEKNMGAFTLIMSDLIKNHTGGKLYTVDISEESLNNAKKYTEEFSDVIEYVLSDSIEFIKGLNVGELDLIYLDSYDLFVPNPHESANHHLKEMMALYDRINLDCPIAIDDNFLPNTFVTWNWYKDGVYDRTEKFQTGDKIMGKGQYCHEFLMNRGWKRFEEFDVRGANNLFYYERGRIDQQRVKSLLDNFYQMHGVEKPTTTRFLSQKNITNSPTGLGDAIILSSLCPEKRVFSKFPQFQELMSFNVPNVLDSSSVVDSYFDINTSDLTNYNWGGGHCIQRLEKAFLGKRSSVPKPRLLMVNKPISKRIGLHLKTNSGNVINNLSDADEDNIKIWLKQHGYDIIDCSKIDDVKTLVINLSYCEYFIGINSGPMHVAAALGLKSIIILNRDDSNDIYLPKIKEASIPDSEWLYPQNVHLSMKNRNELIEKFSLPNLEKALAGQLYPYFTLDYLNFDAVEYNFEKETNRLNVKFSSAYKNATIILKELTTNLKCFHWKIGGIEKGMNYFIVPTTRVGLMNTDFSGFVISLYEDGKHVLTKTISIKQGDPQTTRFYSDEYSDLSSLDHFYIQHLDFCNNRLLDSIVGNGDIVIDVGASCGTFAASCLKRGAKKVICLEPSPSFYILSRTFDDRVECLNTALSTTNDPKKFYFTENTTLNTFNIEEQKKYDTKNMILKYEEKDVECITLSSLIQKSNLSRVNLLKIDIEGFEYEIFDKLKPTDLSVVDKVLIEFHHNTDNKIGGIVDKLKLSGFEVTFLNLSYENHNSQNDLQGVICAKKSNDDFGIEYMGDTSDKLGVHYKSTSPLNSEIVVEIADSYTGLLFHKETITINNKCNYFTKHAYVLPDQTFRIYNSRTKRLLLERVINVGDRSPQYCQDSKNKNLIKLVPADLRENGLIGFSFFEIYHRGTYAFGECNVSSGDTVFDLGANVGMFSRYAFQRGASKVYAFEPNIDLKECFHSLNEGFDYELINKAVYSKPAVFECDVPNILGATISETTDGKESVTINLNDFIWNNNVTEIDYLKVDIEGAEYDLFETISTDFLTDHIKKIAVEYHENKNGRINIILDKLSKCGFETKFEYSDGIDRSLGMLYATKKGASTA